MSNENILSREKVSELRKVIDETLREEDVYSKLRSVIEKQKNEESSPFQKLADSDIVKQVLESISQGVSIYNTTQSIGEDEKLASDKTHFLQLRLLGGRAFVDHLLETPDVIRQFLRLHVTFQGQRYVSQDVECQVEPNFDETFRLQLPQSGRSRDLLSLHDSIHLVLTRHTKHQENNDWQESKTEFVAARSVPWMQVLTQDGYSFSVELFTFEKGGKLNIPIGILDFRMDKFPSTPKPPESIDTYTQRTKEERNETLIKSRRFYQYARQWWNEFAEISPIHKERLVKMFAQDELGDYRCVCTFIQPLQPKGIIDSPNHAARFVSLIPFQRTEVVGGGCDESWRSLATFLAIKCGDSQDHAVLLTSLLIGFNLEAYVCVGTIAKVDKPREYGHVWVMTRRGRGVDTVVTFWEPLKGQRYEHTPSDQDGKTEYPYSSIDCVFNNKTFYANKQSSSSVSTCIFAFENDAYWKALDPTQIATLPLSPTITIMEPEMLSVCRREDEIERKLRNGIVKYRSELGLSTQWSDGMSYQFSPALTAYELERTYSLQVSNQDFQESIKRSVPEGHTFQGFPTIFTHSSPTKMLSNFRTTPLANKIINAVGDDVVFAVRAKIFPYPEQMQAIWVMLAVRYRPHVSRK